MSDPALYLILHKVRGEATWDVAQPLKIGDEMGWIIPTSGHRAYPYRKWLLEDLVDTSDINYQGYHDRPWNAEDRIPADWPDHYPATGAKPLRKAQNDVVTLDLDVLGLGPKELTR